MSAVQAAIVGAGPYGLSIAAYLRAAGVGHRLLGQAMHSWAHCMPSGMMLRSEPFASSLWDPRRRYTYARFCAERGLHYEPIGLPPTLQRFLEYTTWFQQHAVGDVPGDMVRHIRRDAKGFALALADGRELFARKVILATGQMAFRSVPDELAKVAAPHVVHSSLMDEPDTYRDQDVIVVGRGQSALQWSALLHEAGARVRVLTRGDRLKWNGGPKPNRGWIDRIKKPYSGLGPGWKDIAIAELPQVYRAMFPPHKRHRHVGESFGPSGAWWLRSRVENRIPTVFGSTLVDARMSGDKVALTVRQDGDEQELRADRVIAATGFRIDLDRIDYLDPVLSASIEREGSAPRLDRHYQTSVPGLHIVGAASAPTFGPVMRFMFGAKHVAPTLARSLRD
jgi:cation diffusion facilitator CzcD-associated flavoprotein CzcO